MSDLPRRMPTEQEITALAQRMLAEDGLSIITQNDGSLRELRDWNGRQYVVVRYRFRDPRPSATPAVAFYTDIRDFDRSGDAWLAAIARERAEIRLYREELTDAAQD